MHLRKGAVGVFFGSTLDHEVVHVARHLEACARHVMVERVEIQFASRE